MATFFTCSCKYLHHISLVHWPKESSITSHEKRLCYGPSLLHSTTRFHFRHFEPLGLCRNPNPSPTWLGRDTHPLTFVVSPSLCAINVWSKGLQKLQKQGPTSSMGCTWSWTVAEALLSPEVVVTSFVGTYSGWRPSVSLVHSMLLFLCFTVSSLFLQIKILYVYPG